MSLAAAEFLKGPDCRVLLVMMTAASGAAVRPLCPLAGPVLCPVPCGVSPFLTCALCPGASSLLSLLRSGPSSEAGT